jgi:hypothetical protein
MADADDINERCGAAFYHPGNVPRPGVLAKFLKDLTHITEGDSREPLHRWFRKSKDRWLSVNLSTNDDEGAIPIRVAKLDLGLISRLLEYSGYVPELDPNNTHVSSYGYNIHTRDAEVLRRYAGDSKPLTDFPLEVRKIIENLIVYDRGNKVIVTIITSPESEEYESEEYESEEYTPLDSKMTGSESITFVTIHL